jgi:hypothetical protein
MSTWKCYNMSWYVSWAPTPWYGQLGVFIASPHNYSRWTEATAFCRRTDRTFRCTPYMYYSLYGDIPRQPTVGVCSSWPLDLVVTQTVQCRGRLKQYNPVSQISHWILEIHHLVWVRVITPTEHKSYCPSDSKTTTISHIREMLFMKK